MKNKKFVRVLAFVLASVMLLGLLPVTAMAADNEFVSQTHDRFSTTTSTIAPGVTQSVNYAYSKDGKQMVYYVATADVTRDDVIVQTSYKDQYVNKQFGMEKLTTQIAYADQLYSNPANEQFISEYYKVVAGVNASFYNMTTGQPSGITYLDGVQIGESSSYAQFFAILKDGTAIIDYTKNAGKYEGNIDQAAAGSQMLVWDGKDVTANASGSYNTDRHSRTCVGVTADGKVVLMSLDGRQEPFSCGGTMHELAQIMLEQGCVAAINLDGGGSTTFAARQEGANNVTIVNRPSDGSERSISSGLIIASLAAPSDTFDRASLKAENVYVTPGSQVKVTATGVSPAGTAALIPENATWQMKDASMGTVVDGVFTASAKTGAAVVQMAVNGKVVGETTINVVIPDKLVFNSSSMTVPYDKSVELGMTATIGLNEVVLKADDVVFEIAESAIGSLNGFTFTAASEGVAATTSAIKATLVYNAEISAIAEIKLGKGSEVIFDFEDGTTGGLKFSEPEGTKYNYVWPESGEYIVTAENGKVHSGTYAMKAWVNYSNSTESGYMKTSLLGPSKEMIFENATRVGMWIYVPEEAVGLWARWTISGGTLNADGTTYTWAGITGQDMDDTAGGTGVVSSFQESGWHYLSIDTSEYAAVKLTTGSIMQFYISDRDGSAYGYDATDYSNIIGNFAFYMDDITVDYSEAVDDRDAPKFSSVIYADEFTNDAPQLNGQTTKSNVLSFTATVADVVKSNMTGLDASSAKAYIDGVPVDFTFADGKIAVVDVKLADGKHTVKFSICDNMGNYASVIREITVNSGSDAATVKLVPHDAALDRILHGSLYYLDLVATDIDTAKSVTVAIDLDSLSTWQLDHMELAAGFEATYTVDADENMATIVITRTGAVVAEGEAVLASIPVRVWQLKTGYVYPNGTLAGKQAYTAKQFRDMKEFWRISVIANVEYGLLTNTDNTTSTFTGERVFCDTEAWAEDADMIATTAGTAYYNDWNGGHVHTPVAMDDKDVTCTTDGYTGRTFCAGCNSVVDWGTTIPATGHTNSLVDGEFKCVECDAAYGNYTGVVYDDVAEANRYLLFGEVSSGWFMIDDEWYYFVPETLVAAEGNVTVINKDRYGIDVELDFTFVNGKVQGHVWEDWYEYKRCWYGPDYYKNTSANVKYAMVEIDGDIYFFNNAGCMQKGIVVSHESNKFDFFAYDCGTDGKGVPYTGIAEKIYFENGLQVKEGRLVEVDGQYYQIKKTGVMYPSTVILTDSLTGVVFSSDGKIYYAENGYIVAKGAVKVNDDIYYFGSDYAAVANGTYNLSASKLNGLLPAGSYDIKDGKIIVPEVKDGIVNENGKSYYYVNGVKQKGAVKIGDDIYYFSANYYALADGRYYIAADLLNGLLPAGSYNIVNGKIVIPEAPVIKNGIVEENGKSYYYVNDVKQKGAVKIGDEIYYFGANYYALADGRYYIAADLLNGLLPAGSYDIKNGKIIVPEIKNGIVEENGMTYYYVNGAKQKGAVKIGDDIYYFSAKYNALADGRYYIAADLLNGLLPAGSYNIKDGKIVLG